jgi:hypothetical protein
MNFIVLSCLVIIWAASIWGFVKDDMDMGLFGGMVQLSDSPSRLLRLSWKLLPFPDYSNAPRLPGNCFFMQALSV